MSNVLLGRHRTTQELRVDTERRNVNVSETLATECLRGRETASKDRGRRKTAPTGPARPPPGRLAARHSSGHPAVPYIPDSNKQNSVLMYYSNKQNSVLMYYAAGILAAKIPAA